MNPALIGFIRHGITLIFGMVFAKTSLSASDIETLASGAIILLNLAWFAYDRRADLPRRKPKDADPC
jgi:hypothetical protein